jgi:hypothetical protein
MKKRFLAFLVCMAVLLASFTGCYSAQDGPSTLSSSQTMQSNSGSAAENSVEIRTYGIPEENVRANIIYVPSPSTGGFWTCAVFNAKTIQAYDPTTKTAYFPCYQAGCKHNDASCTANFGGVISGFAEYRGNFYAMIYYNDDTASAFVTRPVSGGPLQILASWEPENENEECRCGFYGLSFGKAYLTVSKETYAMKDGQTESVKEEYSKCSLDLETGELVEYMADEDGYLPYMHGVWGDVAVFQDWYADRPDGTPVKRDGSEGYNFRLYSKNLRTGEEKTIVDVTENFVWTADPHVSWGQYTVYQVDRSVYVYDMETQTSKKLFTHEPGWDLYNYKIMDGHVIAICGTEDTCRAWAIDIMDGSVVELDTYGENVVAFSAHYECNGYFVGLLHASNNADKYYISKEDYYRSNYDAAFR